MSEEAYPVPERAFHVVKRLNDDEPDTFCAKDRATLSSFPARDRDDAYNMVSSLNRVVAFHVERALALAALSHDPQKEALVDRDALLEAYRVGFNDGDQGDWNPDTFLARVAALSSTLSGGR